MDDLLWYDRETMLEESTHMETKRCPYCHKLQRADAQICSRCGRTFLSKRSGTRRRDESRPSNPPASPHRAGHYAGLHPEDQPYQSSFLPVQRPPAPTHHVFEAEADQFSSSRAVDSSLTPAPISAPTRRIASFSPSPEPRPQPTL